MHAYYEGSAGLTEGSQILPLDRIQLLWITHKQPDRHVHHIFLDALGIDRSPYFGLLE